MPCAFNKGHPQRRSAALEMIGTVFLVSLTAWHRAQRNIDVTVRGITDSECNTYARLSSYSANMSGAAVHMELMSMARHYGIWPRICHRRRTGNIWADALTDAKFDGFTAALRWAPKYTVSSSSFWTSTTRWSGRQWSETALPLSF